MSEEAPSRKRDLFRRKRDSWLLGRNEYQNVRPGMSVSVGPHTTTAEPLASTLSELQRPNQVLVSAPIDGPNQARKDDLGTHGSRSALSKTPLWDQAVARFRDDHKNDYQELLRPLEEPKDEKTEGLNVSVDLEKLVLNNEIPKMFQDEAQKPQHAVMRRLKSWLPALGAAKGLAMTLARLDPYQLAPYIVAGSFFVIEIVLHSVPADQKDAALEIICDSVIILLKWRSYEENISEIHRTTIDADNEFIFQSLRAELPLLFMSGLLLQARIRSTTTSRKKFKSCDVSTLLQALTNNNAGAAMWGTIEAWKKDLSELKRRDRDCAAIKDRVKDVLEVQEHIAKKLRLIKKDHALDPLHRDVRALLHMDLPEYQSAGRWFLSHHCFRDWMTPESEQPGQRVVWLKGTVGTGKSTLMCQAVSMFCKEQERRPCGNLRVAYYYCSALTTGTTSSKPSKEIILRSLCRRLAWRLTDDIAPQAETFYKKFAAEFRDPPGISDLEELFESLITNAAKSVLLIIDALDECTEPTTLLKYLKKCVQSCSNLFLLLSSRHHVLVNTYFSGGTLFEIDTTAGKHEPDMKVFIQTAVALRKKDDEAAGSIFFKPTREQLLADLIRALSKGANGMFRWVEIWISVLFPLDPQSQICEIDDAYELINQIKKGGSEASHEKLIEAYKILWKTNSKPRNRDLQPRLFQIVLCSFDRLTLKQVTEALRINVQGEKSYRKDLETEHVEWLYYNFLVAASGGLDWAHESAKEFVMQNMMEETTTDFSRVSNHAYMSQIILKLLSEIDHPAWDHAGLHLSQWRPIRGPGQSAVTLTERFRSVAKEIFDAADRAREIHQSFSSQTPQSGPNSELRGSLIDHLRVTDQLSILEPLFVRSSFAFYVVNWFLQHLRALYDAPSSSAPLEQLMQLVISSPKSSLPIIVTLMEHIIALEYAIEAEWFQIDGRFWTVREVDPLLFFIKRLTTLGDSLELYPQLLKAISTPEDGEATFAPLSFLTVINAGSKSLIQHAVAKIRSSQLSVDWDRYPADLLFLACKYNASSIAELLLDPKTFSKFSTLTTSTMLRASRGSSGELPIHSAAKRSNLKMIKLMVEVDDHNALRSNLEAQSANSESKALDIHRIPLLYIPDLHGRLPMRLAMLQYRAKFEVLEWMLQYDAAHAILPLSSVQEQHNGLSFWQKRNSMLLTKDEQGCLPIHQAVHSASEVKLMFQYELAAFNEHSAIQFGQDITDSMQSYSTLLYARTTQCERPIDILLQPMLWHYKDGTEIIDIMLAFENEWASISSLAITWTSSRTSRLLSPSVTGKLLWHWINGNLETAWLTDLLDKYALQPSTVIRPWLEDKGLELMASGSTDADVGHGSVSLQERDMLLQRLKKLVVERARNDEASARDLAETPWPSWDVNMEVDTGMDMDADMVMDLDLNSRPNLESDF